MFVPANGWMDRSDDMDFTLLRLHKLYLDVLRIEQFDIPNWAIRNSGSTPGEEKVLC